MNIGHGRCALALLVLALASPLQAGERWIDGRVQRDDNGNGIGDAAEPGMAGITLSNGRDLVRTDAEGNYRIALRDGDTLFLVPPPGFVPPTGADGLPVFWQHELARDDEGLRYGGRRASRADGRFVLQQVAAQPPRLLVFGDPQPKTSEHVGHFRRDIVESARRHRDVALGISLGDIADDHLALYPEVIAATTSLGLPWLHVPGNHDLDVDAGSDLGSLSTFRQHFGPDTFAWETEHFTVVGFDDVIVEPGTRGYIGGLREDQFAFLEAYLPTVDRRRPLIVAAHIPFFDTSDKPTFRAADRERLFTLLAPFAQPQLLSAHSHVQQHYFHGPEQGWHGATPLHEYNVGAACGGFWGGATDAEGIPDARMADGTPNGYALVERDAERGLLLRWFVARGDEDEAMHLYAPKVLRRGAWPGVPVVANLYMGLPDDVVEVRIDDGDWQPMRRHLATDPWVLAENARDDASNALRGVDRVPQAKTSTHLWRYDLPTNLPAGEHRIEVRTIDRWQGERRAVTHYRLADAP